MENKRAKEVADKCYLVAFEKSYHDARVQCDAVSDFLASLPEFQEPTNEWIHCADRMPEAGMNVDFVPFYFETYGVCCGRYIGNNIWCFLKHDNTLDRFTYASAVTHWRQRLVSQPPEESELVKELRGLFGNVCASSIATTAIEIVKRHEQKSQ